MVVLTPIRREVHMRGRIVVHKGYRGIYLETAHIFCTILPGKDSVFYLEEIEITIPNAHSAINMPENVYNYILKLQKKSQVVLELILEAENHSKKMRLSPDQKNLYTTVTDPIGSAKEITACIKRILADSGGGLH